MLLVLIDRAPSKYDQSQRYANIIWASRVVTRAAVDFYSMDTIVEEKFIQLVPVQSPFVQHLWQSISPCIL